MAPAALTMIVAAVVIFGYNATYWDKGTDIFADSWGLLIVFNFALYFLFVAFLSIFSFRHLVKPAMAGLLVLSAVTSYYMDALGVIIDREMIQNVATTTMTESKHLFTPGFVLHVALFGIMPAAVVLWVKIKRVSWVGTLGATAGLMVLGIALGAGLLMSNYKAYSSILRERKDFMSSFQPGAPIVGAVRYAKMITRAKNAPIAPIGTDAKKGPSYARLNKPVLTIIVAGETARAQNFSLNGYGVPTNPELAKQPVISFSDVDSCGTATAVSLPCMFSKYGRSEYSFVRGTTTENVLDVLNHAGFHVEWWDNNTGSKAIAARVLTRSFTNTKNEEFCPAGECTDGIFKQYLEEFVPSITEDTVLVLHQIGSHGPTYHLRYPPGFEKFSPACRTAEFKNCTQEEITNAYNNTIAYTDHILSEIIEFLAAQDGLITSLLYVSDHGESLGENGIYLHGSPYFMAPEFQTKVPMIMWLSDQFKAAFEVDTGCVAGKAKDALSHENLFHSILGLLDVKTVERQPALDVFDGCQPALQVVRK
ncbi:lipid A ethanolaminephosphotransferase [Litoreibacter janthinus]|uniref:Lipid A ethanolaminephosphotransferase n=2 Tax=Litoreibacter janthinus TaxID=670154 RepID=A0A1I6G6G3_9RHOB|nr:lipid A ethanolaminephosphotransferase [Litoreibacter janthinus]